MWLSQEILHEVNWKYCIRLPLITKPQNYASQILLRFQFLFQRSFLFGFCYFEMRSQVPFMYPQLSWNLLQTRLSLYSQRSFCLCITSAGIKACTTTPDFYSFYVYKCVCFHVNVGAHRVWKSISSPKPGVTGSCEPTTMGIGNLNTSVSLQWAVSPAHKSLYDHLL